MVRIRSGQDSTYVVRASDVNRICALLEKEVGRVRIVTECSDDIERDFSSSVELSSYDNSPGRSLLDMWIQSSRSTETESNSAIESASVYFSKGGRVSISVTGDEMRGSFLKERFREITDGTKAWYSRIAMALDSDILAIVLATLWTVFLLSAFAYLRANSPPPSDPTPVVPPYIVALVAVATLAITAVPLIGLASLIRWLQRALFPRAYFAVGQGEERYKVKDKLRWGLLGLVGAVFVSSLFFAVEQLLLS